MIHLNRSGLGIRWLTRKWCVFEGLRRLGYTERDDEISMLKRPMKMP
jgi:hypothetical protein